MYQLQKGVSALTRGGFTCATTTGRSIDIEDKPYVSASNLIGEMAAQNKDRAESGLLMIMILTILKARIL